MLIVISGTHASGKSTLISDFVFTRPDFDVLPDPFEFLDEAMDAPGPAQFMAQLRLSASRLEDAASNERIIAERGPLDFLAYLLAFEHWTGSSISREVLERATELTEAALRTVDILVLLPLSSTHPIPVSDDEFPELRQLMNDSLLDLVDDGEVLAPHTHVLELGGDRSQRLGDLESALAV